jgi:PTS system nitrogen regulatory IIA component
MKQQTKFVFSLSNFISPNRALKGPSIKSKKKMFEILSALLASDKETPISENIIYQKLYERERIGSTGIGKGVAIPHCRVQEVSLTRMAIIVLDEPIVYDAPDDQLVDIFLAVIFPEKVRDIHLKFLSKVAKFLRDENFRETLRAAENNKALFEILSDSSYQDHE